MKLKGLVFDVTFDKAPAQHDKDIVAMLEVFQKQVF